MNKAAVFLSVNVRYGPGTQVDGYPDEIEDAIRRVTKQHKSVRLGTSSVEEHPEDNWTERFWLNLSDKASGERVTDALIAEIRNIGIKKGFLISLYKRVVDEEREYDRKVFATRNTRWIERVPFGPGVWLRLHQKVVEFPLRIRYLQTLIQRYYLVGGRDVFGVFSRDSELHEFLSSLPKQDFSELRKAYKKVVAAKDHRWIANWVMEDSNVTLAKAQAIHFLVFLHRLCEGGLLDAPPKIKGVQLIDWNQLG